MLCTEHVGRGKIDNNPVAYPRAMRSSGLSKRIMQRRLWRLRRSVNTLRNTSLCICASPVVVINIVCV
ncbi:hypothetical protein SOVF_198320 [Spinacia oleracea]|nr:hypothetical protein SOVF_198320 [Spinacia oleracea]